MVDPGRAGRAAASPSSCWRCRARRRSRRCSRSRSWRPGSRAVDQPTRSSADPAARPARAAARRRSRSTSSTSRWPRSSGRRSAGSSSRRSGWPAPTPSTSCRSSRRSSALLAIKPLPPLGAVVRPGLDAIREGLRYARDRRAILGSFVIDLNAMIFGMPTALFPVLALDVFQTGPAGLGLMAAAPAVGRVPRGAVLGLGLVGPADGPGDRRSPSWRWGLAITAFGLVTVSFPLALAVPRPGRRGGRLLGGVPLDARPARDAGSAARAGDVDPHPRRHERSAARRHRGGRRGVARRAAVRGRVGRDPVRAGRRRRRAAIPGAPRVRCRRGWTGRPRDRLTGGPASIEASAVARPSTRPGSSRHRFRGGLVDEIRPVPDGTRCTHPRGPFRHESRLRRSRQSSSGRSSSSPPCCRPRDPRRGRRCDRARRIRRRDGLDRPRPPDGDRVRPERQGLRRREARHDPASTTASPTRRPTVFADLNTNVHNYWDRGMMGLAIDPDFTSGRPVRLRPVRLQPHPRQQARPRRAGRRRRATRTTTAARTRRRAPTDGCVVSGRLSRLTSIGRRPMTGSENVLIEDWCQQFPSHSHRHASPFGPEGALYVSGGDGASFNAAPGLRPARRDAAGHADAGQPVRRSRRVEPVAADRGGRRPAQPGHPDHRRSDGPRRHDPARRPRHRRRLADQREHRQQRRQRPHGSSPTACATRSASRSSPAPTTSGSATSASARGRRSTGSPTRRRRRSTSAGRATRATASTRSYDNLGSVICATALSAAAVTAPYYTYNHTTSIVSGDGCGTGQLVDLRPGVPAVVQQLPEQLRQRPVLHRLHAAAASGSCPTTAAAPRTSPAGVRFANLDRAGPRDRRRRRLADRRARPATSSTPTTTAARSAASTTTAATCRRSRRSRRRRRSAPAPLTVSFNASGSTDANGGTLTYAWDLDGDGQYDDATGVTTSRTYSRSGTSRSGLRVTDTDGASDTTTRTVSAGNSPPTVSITTPASSLTWSVGQTISFSGDRDRRPGRDPAGVGVRVDADDGALPVRLPLAHHHVVLGREDRAASMRPITSTRRTSSSAVTVTDSNGLTATDEVEIFPKTGTVAATSDPAGIPLTVSAIHGHRRIDDQRQRAADGRPRRGHVDIQQLVGWRGSDPRCPGRPGRDEPGRRLQPDRLDRPLRHVCRLPGAPSRRPTCGSVARSPRRTTPTGTGSRCQAPARSGSSSAT